MGETRGLLGGLKVTEVCMYQQAPVCFAMMADMGADVVKIEPPKIGELGRRTGQPGPHGLRNYFENNNRSKRSLALDYTKPAGKEILYKLAARSDVFAQNYRPGAAKRHKFAYEDIVKIKPDIVYLSASAYGPDGPNAMLPGVDGIAQAMGGIASVNGGENASYRTIGMAVADQTAAFLNCVSVLAALYHRAMTGEGQLIETSLLGGQIGLMGHSMLGYLFTGQLPGRGGDAPRVNGPPLPSIGGNFDDRDGKPFMFSGMTTHYDEFFTALNIEHWRKEERFLTPAKIAENGAEFIDLLKKMFKTKSRDEWVKQLRDGGIIAAPIYNYAEAAADPDVVANNYITEIDHPRAGRFKVVGPPYKFHKTPIKIGWAPMLAEHNVEVLHELGYTDAQIEQFKKDEVI